MIKITDLVDNRSCDGFLPEHGLSLWIEAYGQRILFDSGCGRALLPNATRLGGRLETATGIFLSHGHCDHSGGVAQLKIKSPVYVGRGIADPCYSRHDDGSLHNISMPAETRHVLENSAVHELPGASEFAEGFYSTGMIPRIFPAESGKVFYRDIRNTELNPLGDEQSLLLKDGILITGCCHAGIFNTVEACRRIRPAIRLRTLIGGLHLLHADASQLLRTAEYLNSLGLRRLILLHCTGEAAVVYLTRHLDCEVLAGRAGNVWIYDEDGELLPEA